MIICALEMQRNPCISRLMHQSPMGEAVCIKQTDSKADLVNTVVSIASTGLKEGLAQMTSWAGRTHTSTCDVTALLALADVS